MTGTLTNRLEIEIAIAVFAERARLVYVRSEDLPWLGGVPGSDGAVLNELVDQTLIPRLFGQTETNGALWKALLRLASHTRRNLRDRWEIMCDIGLNFILFEYEPRALDELASRHGLGNLGTLAQNHGAKRVHVSSVRPSALVDVLHEKANEITPTDITFEVDEVVPYPGRAIRCRMESRLPVACSRIRLLDGEAVVIDQCLNVQLLEGRAVELDLLPIPVSWYGALLRGDGRLSIEVDFEGRKTPLRLRQAITYRKPKLTGPPAIIFLDAGSSTTKFMLLDSGIEPTDTERGPQDWSDDWTAQLQRVIEGDTASIAPEFGHPTAEFAEHYGIRFLDKEALDRFGDRELAAHLASCMTRVAARLYEAEERLLAQAFWAFPNTGQRNFSEINATMGRALEGIVLAGVQMVEEAEALRLQFEPALRELSRQAKDYSERRREAIDKNREAELARERIAAEWQAYENRPLWERVVQTVTGRRPMNPSGVPLRRVRVPTLEEWHKTFSAIDADEGLSEFVVLDAGGYSLDAYASFGESDRQTLSKSFRAGGHSITSAIAAYLAEERECDIAEISRSEAENNKKRICTDPEQYQNHPLLPICRQATEKCYGGPVDAILAWIRSCRLDRGFPLLMTGGGSLNPFLRELVARKLAECELLAVPADSSMLYGTLRKAREGCRSDVGFFLNIVSAFHTEEEIPRAAPFTDVVGGLGQLVLSRLGEPQGEPRLHVI